MRSSLAETERVCKALGNRRRLAIVQLLALKGRVSVTAIADHIKLSLPSTSRHLRILSGADIVESEQSSTTVAYFLSKDRLSILDATLKSLR